MNSKFKCRAVFLLIVCTVLTCIFGSLTVFASETADSGVAYKISDDGTYIIIEGYNDILPNVKIEAEIDGLPVKEIAESAFQNRLDIYSVTIPDSVEKIGEAAFRNCVNLKTVRLPSGLDEIPFECFRDCKILDSVKLPEALTEIGPRAFDGCTMLGRLTIPASVKEIGYDAFYNCESIVLDCSQNEYAQNYAVRFNINTDFKGTTLYFVMMMALGTIFFAVIAFILIKIFNAHIKKHPSHNPGIYIAKFFSLIWKGICFVFSNIWKFIGFIIGSVIDAFDRIKRKK